ncbi:seminal metalloprotease 1-like isoform X2 [Pieris brassicae]|uniref:seminal metalloprotease 1-like isoform X2 n=1 Tax=Pieris brassicae TaxID=7116 RepID=UPI001E661DF3|nr:seminal metalloprotease 1-like isoform X2 [Pieris brassicae]
MKIYLFLFFHVFFAFAKNIERVAEYDLKLLSGPNSQDLKKIQDAGDALWPFGIITYYLDTKSYDEIIAQRVYSVMDAVQSASCVQFKSVMTKPLNVTWLHITNPQKKRECVHKTFQLDRQEITVVLGYDCLKESDILHALLHAIGLKDEVTHPYRDRYMRVLWNNIKPEYRHLYQIQGLHSSKVLTEYDPTSVMHFHDRAFSSNGQATIVPLISGLMIAPSDHLSQLDTMKLRLMFEHECNKRKVSEVIDSCKNVFHDKLTGSVNVMANILENGDDNNSPIKEGTNEKSVDNIYQVHINSSENDGQSNETEISDDYSEKSDSDIASSINDGVTHTKKEISVEDSINNYEENKNEGYESIRK